MYHELDLSTMELINGGDNIDNFCNGFGAVAGVYAVGALANWWNPIGWAGTTAGIIVGAGCGVYAIR